MSYDNYNGNNIIFTIKGSKLYVPVVTLSAKEKQISSKFKSKKYYLPKCIINNYKVFINGKKIYDQPINSDIKRYEGIRKLTTGEGEDYTTGCL